MAMLPARQIGTTYSSVRGIFVLCQFSDVYRHGEQLSLTPGRFGI
jgi:hypothetical protein